MRTHILALIPRHRVHSDSVAREKRGRRFAAVGSLVEATLLGLAPVPACDGAGGIGFQKPLQITAATCARRAVCLLAHEALLKWAEQGVEMLSGSGTISPRAVGRREPCDLLNPRTLLSPCTDQFPELLRQDRLVPAHGCTPQRCHSLHTVRARAGGEGGVRT